MPRFEAVPTPETEILIVEDLGPGKALALKNYFSWKTFGEIHFNTDSSEGGEGWLGFRTSVEELAKAIANIFKRLIPLEM